MVGMYNYRGLQDAPDLQYAADAIDPETGLPLGSDLPGGGIDFSSGEVDPSTIYSPTTGGASTEDYLTAWEGSEGVTSATPEEQAAAQAWLLQNVPVAARSGNAAALSTLALTAAQIAAGVSAGTVKTSAACPSGYSFSTGVCVPKSGAVATPAGQWFSFATNQQVTTFGLVILGALIFVNLIPSGGRRR